MSGVGTTRVEVRNQELRDMILYIKKNNTDKSLEVQALMIVSAQLSSVIDLLGDLINEVSPVKYNEDGP